MPNSHAASLRVAEAPAVVEAAREAVVKAVTPATKAVAPRNSKLRWRGLACGAVVALFLAPGFLEYLITVRTKALALKAVTARMHWEAVCEASYAQEHVSITPAMMTYANYQINPEGVTQVANKKKSDTKSRRAEARGAGRGAATCLSASVRRRASTDARSSGRSRRCQWCGRRCW